MIKSRKIRWVGHVARMGERSSAQGVLVEKLEGKRPVGRSRCRWEGDIKINRKEREWGCMDWINLAQDRDEWRALVNMVMNLQVP
jgi:hypothetical protein